MNHHPEERMGSVIDVYGDELNIVIISYGICNSVTITANGPFWVRLRAHNNQLPWTWITCSVMIARNNTVYFA